MVFVLFVGVEGVLVKGWLCLGVRGGISLSSCLYCVISFNCFFVFWVCVNVDGVKC